MNAIYTLSVKKSGDTSEAIIALSELMRYMLYEADKDKVPLGKELEYIKNYVQLQRLRLSDSSNVKLRISGEERNKEIPRYFLYLLLKMHSNTEQIMKERPMWTLAFLFRMGLFSLK